MLSSVLAGPNRVPLTAITPSVCDLRVTSARAARLGRYPSSFIACSTRSRVAGRTFGARFTTLDTVMCETPASRATSLRTGDRFVRLTQLPPDVLAPLGLPGGPAGYVDTSPRVLTRRDVHVNNLRTRATPCRHGSVT